eukprot:273266-Amorphochlora_amoeboformis.AAC.1
MYHTLPCTAYNGLAHQVGPGAPRSQPVGLPLGTEGVEFIDEYHTPPRLRRPRYRRSPPECIPGCIEHEHNIKIPHANRLEKPTLERACHHALTLGQPYHTPMR